MIRDMGKLTFFLKLIQQKFSTISKKGFTKTEYNGYEIALTHKDKNNFMFKLTPISSDEPVIVITTGRNGAIINIEEEEEEQ